MAIKKTTISEAAEATRKFSEGYFDNITNSKLLGFSPDNKDIITVTGQPDLFNRDGSTLICKAEDWAGQQLNGRLDGPDWGWIKDDKRCNADLAYVIRKHLVDDRGDMKLLARHRADGTVRAILSDEYVPFNNVKIIKMIADAVEQEGFFLANFQTGDTMRGYALDPNSIIGVDPRDPTGDRGGKLHPGFYFSNNETGRGGVRFAAGVFTGVCSNGAIFGWNERSTDVGSLFVIHRWISENALADIVAQYIAKSLNLSEAAAEAYIASYQVKIGGKSAVAAAIEKLRAKHGMTQEEGIKWETLTMAEANNRGSEDAFLGDLVNGLTVQAHQREDPLEKQSLEVLAGTLMGDLFKKAVANHPDLVEVEAESAPRQLSF